MDWNVDVVVLRCRRARSSRDGNPAYTLDTDKGPYRTATDTAQAYNLESSFPVETSLEIPATLKLTNGRVFDWTLTGTEKEK